MGAPRVHEAIPGFSDHEATIAAMMADSEMAAAMASRGRAPDGGACMVTVAWPDGRVTVALARECEVVQWVETEEVTGPDDAWRHFRPVSTHLRLQLTDVIQTRGAP